MNQTLQRTPMELNFEKVRSFMTKKSLNFLKTTFQIAFEYFKAMYTSFYNELDSPPLLPKFCISIKLNTTRNVS